MFPDFRGHCLHIYNPFFNMLPWQTKLIFKQLNAHTAEIQLGLKLRLFLQLHIIIMPCLQEGRSYYYYFYLTTAHKKRVGFKNCYCFFLSFMAWHYIHGSSSTRSYRRYRFGWNKLKLWLLLWSDHVRLCLHVTLA